MNLKTMVLSEIKTANPPSVTFRAEAGLTMIEVSPEYEHDVEGFISMLEGAGFDSCEVVKEPWAKLPVIKCHMEPSLITKLFSKIRSLKSRVGLADTAFLLSAMAANLDKTS